MRSRIYTFESEQIIVHWDSMRCIHVEECIRCLPEVFDRDRRPWIDPSLATAERVAWACERCPTGALHYERLDGGPVEQTPGRNEIVVSSDGPLYVKGDVRVVDGGGQSLLKETRVALCRCGQSRNKPLCDGSHEKSGFEAEGALTEAHVNGGEEGEPASGELLIRAANPGPLTIKGSAQIRGDRSNNCCLVRVGALCCCGKSKNKPFCDGSHTED